MSRAKFEQIPGYQKICVDFPAPDGATDRGRKMGGPGMLEIPIYRPEITVHQLDPDGVWDTKYGVITNTLFYPVEDDDGAIPTEGGFRRVVRFGSEPAFTILAPDGCRMEERGRAKFLRTVEGDKLHDAVNALIYAKRREFGLELLRAGAARPVATAPPIVTTRSKPSVQLAMF